MKLTKLLLILGVTSAIAISCNKGNSTENYIGMATVQETTEGYDVFKVDNGPTLLTSNLSVNGQDGRRVLLYYYLTGKPSTANAPYDDIAYVTGYRWVLTKDVIQLTAENATQIGNDPFFELYDMDIAGGYLNAFFAILFDQVPHSINLVENTLNGPAVVGDQVALELRQNAFGFNSGSGVYDIASFNLNKYKQYAIDNNLTKLYFKVKMNFFNGISKEINLVYNINADSGTSQAVSTQFLMETKAVK